MSQHDMDILNAANATVRADFNLALKALASQSSGANDPPTPYAYQRFARTDLGVIKRRNAANNGDVLDDTLAETLVSAKSAGFTAGLADFKRTFICTNSFSAAFSAAATLGDGWWTEWKNNGSGTITLDPNATETIDGAATLALAPGQSCVVVCDGSALYTIGLGAASVPVGTIIDFSGTSAPAGYLVAPTALTYIDATTYKTLAFAIGVTWGNGGTTINAGGFVPGNTYVIKTVGTTDFTLIGAASNTVGLTFTATGAGSGTGVANNQIALPWFANDYAAVQANVNVGSSTVGQVIAHTHNAYISGGSTNFGASAPYAQIGASSSTGGSANLPAGVRVLKCVKY